MFNRLLLLTALLALLANPTWAGIKPGAFTLSPMVGGQLFDDDQQLDEALLGSLGLGYNITKQAALEAVYSQANADGETALDSDAKVRTFRLDALYHFMADNDLVPYLAIGLGEINSNPDAGQNRRHLLGNLGGGIKYFLNDLVALRADVRYLLDLPEPNHNLLYSAGLLFQFGGAAPAPAPVQIAEPAPAPAPAPVLPKDSDNDGVLDAQDQCPGTPQGTPVNSLGCPIDSDADGVYDPLDLCPNSPRGEPVDQTGCPLDSDGDGVYDHLDQCPGTPQGVSVDAGGCPTKLTLRINFGLDSDQISSAYDSEIAKAAECINNYPGNQVFIDGHTDSLGPAAYNQKLSERRANAVKNRLIEKFNIPASRLTSRGFGEEQPIADNTTAEGQFQNRRVEVGCGATK